MKHKTQENDGNLKL